MPLARSPQHTFLPMNIRHTITALLAALVSTVSSCLSDDEVTVTTYDDAALTAFSIGTLPRTLHTTGKQGQDSTYTSSTSCDSYAFTIDQQSGLVYNVDSLPEGTDTRACLPTITAKNGGYIYIKNLENDSLRYYSSVDSIDFRQPRTIRVYANDGTWERDYRVEVRVHREQADKFYWQRKADNAALAALEGMRGLFWGGSIVVYGTDGDATRAYATPSTDGGTWHEVELPTTEPLTMATDGTRLYALTADGTLWEREASASRFTRSADALQATRLVGATRAELYALTAGGSLMRSADKGATWTADIEGADAAMLPTADITSATVATATNADVDRIVLLGNRGAASDSTCVVWTKYVDTTQPKENGAWIFQPFTAQTWHHAPALSHLTVAPYASGLILIGGDGTGACRETEFAKVRFSRDNGLNWWTDSRLALPDGFQSSHSSFALVADGDNRLWLIAGQTGQVWRGYLSQLTWQ